mmetsp:Transcript_11770/g.27891  ORF Transcript_11770/g.27891 Transcript_11770/m.27891 type:complete len:156 (-) Transcript_11770:235-702(-)
MAPTPAAPTRTDDKIAEIRRRADRGEARAQFMLGWCYDQGDGVEQDHFEAARLYRLAADQGHLDAQVAISSAFAMIRARCRTTLRLLASSAGRPRRGTRVRSRLSRILRPRRSPSTGLRRGCTPLPPCRRAGPCTGSIQLWDVLQPWKGRQAGQY